MDETQSSGLFDRIPGELLRPLTGGGRAAMWELLVHLNEALFCVDVLGGNGDGHLRRRVIDEIQSFLLDRVDWHGDEEDAEKGSVGERANALLNRIIDCGWIKPHVIGARTYLLMPPVVQRFLETLIKFAEDGAQFVSGRVQIIFNSLRALADTTELRASDAALLSTVARDARDLLSSLANTSVRIRDVLALLREEDVTSRYVQRFFRDYISDLYIKDYRDLRTENHPMRHRNDIVAIAEEMRGNLLRRDGMIRAYKDHHKVRNIARAEQMFEKDIAFILRFRQVEEYLDRLDDNVNRATRAALATLSYRLRTPSNLSQQLLFAAQAVAALPDHAEITWPLMQGAVFGTDRLRQPVVPYTEPEISKIRRRPLTPEQRAYSEMRRAMVRARQVSAAQVRKYRETRLPQGTPVSSEQLRIETVEDLVMAMALSRASFLRASMPPRRQKDDPLLRAMRGLEISAATAGDDVQISEHLRVPRFVVRRVE